MANFLISCHHEGKSLVGVVNYKWLGCVGSFYEGSSLFVELLVEFYLMDLKYYRPVIGRFFCLLE